MGMLDDPVRAGGHQRGGTVVGAHQVGRLPARSADVDDLARPPRMAHDVGVHVEPIADGCLHAPTSSSAFAHSMSAFSALPEPEDTPTMYSDWHGPAVHVHAAGSYRPGEAFALALCAVPHPAPRRTVHGGSSPSLVESGIWTRRRTGARRTRSSSP